MRTPPLMLTLGLAAALAGCDRAPTNPPPSDAASQPKLSAWRGPKSDAIVGVDPSADAKTSAKLAAAIAEARASADSARLRWEAADEHERERWSVKWAAETVDGEIEHVWVRPIRWSPFRIEGTLASQPHAELACSKTLNEIVSFPIEELSDWVHFKSDVDVKDAPNSEDQFEGGFTIKALQERFGRP